MTSLLLATALLGQPQPDAEAAWHKYFQAVAEEYRLTTAESPAGPCTLRKTSIFNWNQPVRGGDAGRVYVWLRDGRPAALGTIFAWPMADGRRNVTHEFHSLDTVPLKAQWKELQWSPEKPGVAFADVPNAAAPQATETQRMAQMRLIARRFKAVSYDKNDQEWDLRILPQPLYRYEIQDSKTVLDGAIFSAVQGTDPEVLLLLEAHKDETKPRWKYALARLSDLRLRVDLDDKPVWSVQKSTYDDKTGVYWVRSAEELKSPPEPVAQKKP